MATKKVPDLSEAGWYLIYRTELYYDPQEEKYAPVKLIEPISKENLATQKRLTRYWFATVHIFRNVNLGLEAYEVRVFDKHPVVRRWGPIGDRDIWATAAWLGDHWQMVRSNDSCEYGYQLSEDKKSLVGIEFLVSTELIKEYQKSSKS